MRRSWGSGRIETAKCSASVAEAWDDVFSSESASVAMWTQEHWSQWKTPCCHKRSWKQAYNWKFCLTVYPGIDCVSLLNEIISMCRFNSFKLQKPSFRFTFPASEHHYDLESKEYYTGPSVTVNCEDKADAASGVNGLEKRDCCYRAPCVASTW